MASAPLLNPALLEELELRWRTQGAPIADHLRPGLSVDEMDRIVAPLGIRLPVEARTWWGWHDGGDGPGFTLGPDWPFLSLSRAVEAYVFGRSLWVEMGEDPEFWWPRDQFTITRMSCGDVTVDCSVPEGSASPVYFAESHGRNPDVEFAAPKARSMGEMVGWLIDAFDDGAWAYDRGAARWLFRTDRVPLGRDPLV